MKSAVDMWEGWRAGGGVSSPNQQMTVTPLSAPALLIKTFPKLPTLPVKSPLYF